MENQLVKEITETIVQETPTKRIAPSEQLFGQCVSIFEALHKSSLGGLAEKFPEFLEQVRQRMGFAWEIRLENLVEAFFQLGIKVVCNVD